jgi:hypothetical protein
MDGLNMNKGIFCIPQKSISFNDEIFKISREVKQGLKALISSV